MDIIQFFIVGSVSVIFTALFLFIPLSFSKIGKAKWSNKFSSLTYFACLGAGFIIIEVVFIQIFMKLIGSPLYTYSTVIFSLLLSAGVGSLCSKGLKINLNKRWHWPFVGILLACCLLIFSHTSIFNVFMKTTLFARISVAALMIFPLGFFLGMPFPLGILSLSDKPKGAVAWAWGMNGLFTVIGGFSTILLSIFYGFKLTLLFSLVCYSLAFATFSRIRRSALFE